MPRTAANTFARFHDDLDSAKTEAARLNSEMEPGKDGKEKTQYRAYKFTLPKQDDDKTVCVVARSAQEAVHQGCTNFGVTVDGGTIVRVPTVDAFLDMITPEQLAKLEKEIKERKKAAAGK